MVTRLYKQHRTGESSTYFLAQKEHLDRMVRMKENMIEKSLEDAVKRASQVALETVLFTARDEATRIVEQTYMSGASFTSESDLPDEASPGRMKAATLHARPTGNSCRSRHFWCGEFSLKESAGRLASHGSSSNRAAKPSAFPSGPGPIYVSSQNVLDARCRWP